MRWMSSSALAFVLVGAAAVFGCGSTSAPSQPSLPVVPLDGGSGDVSSGTDGSPSSSDDLPPAKVEPLCAEAAARSCEVLDDCVPSLLDLTWSSRSACETRLTKNCTLFYPSSALLSGSEAKAFLDCMGTLTCDSLSAATSLGPWSKSYNWLYECAVRLPRLETPKPVGANCYHGVECASRRCGSTLFECGKCEPMALPAGASCELDEECLGGCAEGSCYAPAYLGQPCDEEHRCAFSTVCTDGRCVKPRGIGESCGAGAPCDPVAPAACNHTTGFCEEIALLDPGEPCPFDESDLGPHYLNRCAKGSDCGVNAVNDQRMCLEPGGVGATCNGFHAGCEAGLYCYGGVCGEPHRKACP